MNPEEIEKLECAKAEAESSKRILELVESQLTVANKRIEELENSLLLIKNLVCGSKDPNWSDTYQTTATRGVIADICDGKYGHPNPISQASRVLKGEGEGE